MVTRNQVARAKPDPDLLLHLDEVGIRGLGDN